jgi:hypothetical protein
MEGSCFWAQGISRESGKIKGGLAGEGEMGEGGETWMRKTEGNYIYFLYIMGIHQVFTCPINSADMLQSIDLI